MVLSCLVMSDSLRHPGLQPSRLLCPWDSVDKNTGVGCHALLQGIFPTQESKPSLPYCRQIVYHLSHRGNPRILKWVVYPFSRGTSWPGNWTRVSCIVGGVFTIMSYQGSPQIGIRWVLKEHIELLQLTRQLKFFNASLIERRVSLFSAFGSGWTWWLRHWELAFPASGNACTCSVPPG